jgi:hypothetical protein
MLIFFLIKFKNDFSRSEMYNCFGMNGADELKIKADRKDRQFIYASVSINRNMIGVTLNQTREI